jgi:hypothetical protein
MKTKGNPNFGGKNREALQRQMRGSKNCNAKLSEENVKAIKDSLTVNRTRLLPMTFM